MPVEHPALSPGPSCESPPAGPLLSPVPFHLAAPLTLNLFLLDTFFLIVLYAIPHRMQDLGSLTCPTLGDPMDCSPPGSVRGIFRDRILEWVAISFSILDASLITGISDVKLARDDDLC